MLCNCIIRGSLSIISQGSQLLVTPANPFAYAISEISYSANQIGKDIQTDNVMNYLNEGEYFLVLPYPNEATKKAKQHYG